MIEHAASRCKALFIIGPWWWSSGQRARLILRRSNFDSRKILQQFFQNYYLKGQKEAGLVHFTQKSTQFCQRMDFPINLKGEKNSSFAETGFCSLNLFSKHLIPTSWRRNIPRNLLLIECTNGLSSVGIRAVHGVKLESFNRNCHGHKIWIDFLFWPTSVNFFLFNFLSNFTIQ